MASQEKSIIVRCMHNEGIKTRFGSEVKMLIHPAFTRMEQNASALWVTLPPGASTGRHNHPNEVEFEYIVSGKGILKTGDDETVVVEPFMLVLNPPGLDHNVVNTGSEIMHLLRVHVPSLPGEGTHENLIDQCIQAAKRNPQNK
jgi:mannose-6-phosphate isomerase-like protein (cupin superfamily)